MPFFPPHIVDNSDYTQRKANDFRTHDHACLHPCGQQVRTESGVLLSGCRVSCLKRRYKYPRTGRAKRVSRVISYFIPAEAAGSMTVEASLAVPIFFFFTVNVLSMILFFHTYATNLEELHQQGRQLSMAAYAAGDILPENEIIQLMKPARLQPAVPVIGYSSTTIVSCCYMRAWTGYDVEHKAPAEDGEEYVYITEYGEVYHRARNCTHLALSIELAGEEEVEGKRNQSGERYRPCEKCGGEGLGIVYITKEGNRYHNTIHCSGLKRSVRCVPLSEAGSRTACGRCG